MKSLNTACLSILVVLPATPLCATPACEPAPKHVLERFMPADCETCWQAADRSAAQPASWVLDWIVPTDKDETAALSLAALPEAAQRLERTGQARAAQPGVVVRDANLAALRPALKLQVQAGPAWSGYFGVQLRVSGGTPPRHSTGWLALVEEIPAGAEGSAVPRRLVRAVSGPLSLDTAGARKAVQHLRALRVGEGARPERLRAVGWVESADGNMLAVASEGCPAR